MICAIRGSFKYSILNPWRCNFTSLGRSRPHWGHTLGRLPFPKEPHVPSKELCILWIEPSIHSKELCIHTKEPIIYSKELLYTLKWHAPWGLVQRKTHARVPRDVECSRAFAWFERAKKARRKFARKSTVFEILRLAHTQNFQEHLILTFYRYGAYLHTNTNTHTHTFTHSFTHTHSLSLSHTPTHTRTHAHTHTQGNTTLPLHDTHLEWLRLVGWIKL